MVLTYGIPPEFDDGVHLLFFNRHTPSGQSRVYRVTRLRTDDVHCRESASTGPVNLKVVPNECCLSRSPWTNQYAPLFPTITNGMKWLWHVESTGHSNLCVFSSHSFWTSSSLDVPAGFTQEEGHTGFLIHLLSAVRALIFLAKRIQSFLSLVDRVIRILSTNDYVLHPLGTFFFFFREKNPV